MNRRARLRLRGLASPSGPAPAPAPIAGGSGAIERERSDAPIDRAFLGADGLGDAMASLSDAPGSSNELPAAGEPAHRDLGHGLVYGAVAAAPVARGIVGESLNGEALDGSVARNPGRALRMLRALRTARALRLAIALAMTPGTGVE